MIEKYKESLILKEMVFEMILFGQSLTILYY